MHILPPLKIKIQKENRKRAEKGWETTNIKYKEYNNIKATLNISSFPIKRP